MKVQIIVSWCKTGVRADLKTLEAAAQAEPAQILFISKLAGKRLSLPHFFHFFSI